MHDYEALEKRLEALEREVQRQKDVKDCFELMVKYQIYHHPMTALEKSKIFALTMPDVSMEVSKWGKYVGAEAIMFLQNIFTTAPLNGVMWNHNVDSPVIEIAKDGQTAKGLFFSPGAEAHREPAGDGKVHAYWCWGKYTVDFIKENGEWKIWHLHWWRSFRNDFYKSWVDDAETTLTKAPWEGQKSVESQLKNAPKLEPTTFFQYYNPNKVTPCIPWFPKPYDTWKEGEEDWVYGPFKEFWLNQKPYDEVFTFENINDCPVYRLKDDMRKLLDD